MHWIVRILLGLAISTAGFFMVWKAEDAVGWFGGKSYWAEFNFGFFGGTAGLVKVAGIVAMFVGFGVMVGLHTSILGGIVGLVIPATRQ